MSKRKTNQHARTQKCPELEPRKAHVPKASPLPSSQVPDPSIWRKAWEICHRKMVISCGEVWWSHVKFAIDRSHIYHTKLYSYLLGGFNQPLWKIWVRQLGWWNSQYMESHKTPWFQTTSQLGDSILTGPQWHPWHPPAAPRPGSVEKSMSPASRWSTSSRFCSMKSAMKSR